MRKTTRPVRRSQRGKRQIYQVGDVVEVVRGSDVCCGQLLHKMEKGRNHEKYPVWLVSFDESDREDEEICEDNFGPLLQKGRRTPPRSMSPASRLRSTASVLLQDQLDSSPSGRRGGRAAARVVDDNQSDAKGAAVTGRRRSKRSVGEVTTTSSRGRRRKNARKDGDGIAETSNLDYDLAAPTSGGKKRYNQKDDTTNAVDHDDLEDGSRRISTRASSKAHPRSRTRTTSGRTGSTSSSDLQSSTLPLRKNPSRKKHGKLGGVGGKSRNHDPNETVEKVKFLTGTLYLYRGENQRVVFVRSV